jgi:hypothetical protein
MPEGVVSEEDFVRYLKSLKENPARGGIRGEAPLIEVASPDRPLFFAAMPFAPGYADTFHLGMTKAAEAVGGVCLRADHDSFRGDIVTWIKSRIDASVAVVADLSESRPNVLFEVGYAEALGRPVIQISSTPLEDLPFDVRNNRTLEYRRGEVYKLVDALEREYRDVLSGV